VSVVGLKIAVLGRSRNGWAICLGVKINPESLLRIKEKSSKTTSTAPKASVESQTTTDFDTTMKDTATDPPMTLELFLKRAAEEGLDSLLPEVYDRNVSQTPRQ